MNIFFKISFNLMWREIKNSFIGENIMSDENKNLEVQEIKEEKKMFL